MLSSLRTLTFFAWSLTLSLHVLKVHSNDLGNVQPQYAENIYKRTSGCSESRRSETNSDLLLVAQNITRHYPLRHYRGLVTGFQITLLKYIEAVQNVSVSWESEGRFVPVSEWGLRDLYPLSNETRLHTSAGPGDEHRILRESRWLLTSAEAHVQLLHSINYTRTDVFRNLESTAQNYSRQFARLLSQFRVTGLPEQANCVSTTVPRNQSLITRQAEFTTMALRDIQQALLRVQRILVSCETQWADRADMAQRRPRLHCSEASVFNPTMPEGFTWLYHYSDALAA